MRPLGKDSAPPLTSSKFCRRKRFENRQESTQERPSRNIIKVKILKRRKYPRRG